MGSDMTSFVGRRLGCAALVAAWVVCAGCGGGSGQLPTVPAAGTVSYKGKPVAKGTVHSTPEAGPPASGVITDGKFTLTTYTDGDGAVAGKHKVGVEVTEEVKTKDGDTSVKYVIPQKYASPDSSDIKVDIPPGGKKDIAIDIK
jgi:hypothetical protein